MSQSQTTQTNQFYGDTKVGESFTSRKEQEFIQWAVPKIPRWISSHHLVFASLGISLLLVITGYIAHRWSNLWLLLSCVLVLAHWVTDSLDGSLGRSRQEGLVRWGYYMDHLFDYVFLAAVWFGYAQIFPATAWPLLFAFFALCAGFMIHAYLAIMALKEFRIYFHQAGPTEARLFFIALMAVTIVVGPHPMMPVLSVLMCIGALFLISLIYQTHKQLWELDKKNLREN